MRRVSVDLTPLQRRGDIDEFVEKKFDDASKLIGVSPTPSSLSSRNVIVNGQIIILLLDSEDMSADSNDKDREITLVWVLRIKRGVICTMRDRDIV